MEIREKKRWGDVPFCLLWTFVFGLLAPQAEVDAIAQSETARSMGVFPAADSVQMVDGCVCVRISPAED